MKKIPFLGVFSEKTIKIKKKDWHPIIDKSEKLETTEMDTKSDLVKMQQWNYMQPLKL